MGRRTMQNGELAAPGLLQLSARDESRTVAAPVLKLNSICPDSAVKSFPEVISHRMETGSFWFRSWQWSVSSHRRDIAPDGL